MHVVFLDRDGTVVVDPPDERVDRLDKIQLFPDSIDALRYLAEHDFAVVFITNQAGIAEGRLTEDEFWQLHEEVLRQLAPSGVRVLKTYMNGEAPGPDATEWRKPGPKMLLQAADDFNLDLSEIYMAGDNQSDVQAAQNAGCKGGILVKTGNKSVESADAVFTAKNLMEVAQYVVAHG